MDMSAKQPRKYNRSAISFLIDSYLRIACNEKTEILRVIDLISFVEIKNIYEKKNNFILSIMLTCSGFWAFPRYTSINLRRC